jgi:hypothetical protein
VPLDAMLELDRSISGIRIVKNHALTFAVALALAIGARGIDAQVPATPDECFGFSFGAWSPPLRSVASTYSPGYDPTASAPSGAPRGWAARSPGGGGAQADSVLLLFPNWWPAGVAIQWTEQRGDTLIGIARALVADGKVRNPETAVRAKRVPCGKGDGRPSPPPSDTVASGS